MGKGKSCVIWTLAFLILIVAVLLLAGVVGLATVGIINAQEADERYIEAIASDDDQFEFYWRYWMAGSSGCGLILCFFGSLAILMLIKACKTSHPEYNVPDDANRIEMKNVLSSKADEDRTEQENVSGSNKPDEKEGEILLVQGESLIKYKEPLLEPLTCSSMITLFISVFFFIAALLCLLWGIAIAYDNSRRPDKTIAVYAIVDAVVGLAMPIFLVVSLTLASVFLEYITRGRVDPRVVMEKMLPGVKLITTKNMEEYWSIQGRFYFKIKQHDYELHRPPSPDRRRISCSDACSHTPTTWILTIIVGLSFLLAATYFMNSTITEQTTLSSCPHVSYEVDCFNKTTYSYINCQDPDTANTSFELLHCFRFLDFGVSSDPIGALSSSVAFYLASLGFFTVTFHVVKILMHFRASKVWGIGFIILGVLTFAAAVAVMLTEDAVALRFNVIGIFEFYTVAIYIILIGFLLVLGEPKEVIPLIPMSKVQARQASKLERV